MTPRAPRCLLAHTVSAAPAWVASQSPPGCLPSLVTCVFSSSLHKNVSAGPGPLSTPLLMQPPHPQLHPGQAQACPLPPAARPNTPVYLWAWPRMEGRLAPSHLLPTCPHTPSSPPPSSLSSFWKSVHVRGGGEWFHPQLSSAGAWPSAAGQPGARGRGRGGSQAAGACGELARGAGCALGRAGKGLQLQAPALSPHHMEAGAKGTT